MKNIGGDRMEIEQIALCVIVCLAKILEISIQSVKTVCLVKNQKGIAACLAFVECLVWGLVISSIITSLSDNLSLLLSYCLGYALGIVFGSIIENHIALGTSNIQVIVNKEHISIVEDYLRENNHGFTVLQGRGSKDEMYVVIMVLPRKHSKKIINELKEKCEGNLFLIASDINSFVGGYGVKK